MASRPMNARYRDKATGVYVEAFDPVAAGKAPLPFTAAGTGPRAAAWRSSNMGPNAALSGGLATLRNRAREAVRNNPYAENAVATWESNVVGTGIKPLFTTSDKGLNKALGELWLEWTDEADADGRLDFYGLQALAVREIAEAGEVFGRLRQRRPGDMDTVPLQLQLLEAEFCPAEKNESRSGLDTIMGVGLDKIGQRVGYWMYRRHPSDLLFAQAAGADGMPHFVPASEVLHLYAMRRAGELRGSPWLTRALIKLRDLDEYDDATLVRAKIAAFFAGFIRKLDPDGTFMGEYDPVERMKALAPLMAGTLQLLWPGEEIEFSKGADVGATYEPFMTVQLRGVAAATRTLYEQLSGDYSKINDRQYRAAVNEFRRSVMMVQHHLTGFQLCRPVLRRWIDTALLADAIAPPRGMPVRELYRVQWIPQAWPYLHPEQDVNAKIKETRAGLKPRSKHISEAGEDPEAIDDIFAADNARADAKGLAFDSDGRRKSGGGSEGASSPDAQRVGGRRGASGDDEGDDEDDMVDREDMADA